MELNSSQTNFTNQTKVTSLDENTLVTIFWVFIIPGICLFGVISNTICIILLIKANLQDHMHKYMLASSVINVVYTFMCGFIFLIKCGSMCPMSKTSIVVVLYEYLIWDYVTSCLAVLNILLEIIMCLQRCSIVSNWSYFKFERFYVVFLVVILISLVPYIPYLFLREIISDANYEYKIVDTKMGLSNAGDMLKLFVACLRGLVPLLIFVIINVFTAIKFIKLLHNKNKMKFKQKVYEKSIHFCFVL